MLWRRLRYTYVDENGVRTHGIQTGESDVRAFVADMLKKKRDLQYLYVEQLAEWEIEEYVDEVTGEQI